MKRFFTVVFCLVFTMCGCSVPTNRQQDKISVVTTVFPVYDFVRAVGGDNINLEMLINAGTEVHSYEPVPSDMMAVYGCDIFLYVGGESESWARSLVSEAKCPSVALIENIGVDCEHEHEHGNHKHADEHIWTSPENAVLMLREICDSLCTVDKENAQEYKNNCEEYVQKILEAANQTQEVLKQQTSPFIIVADRFPFSYFTEFYGIEYEAAFDACAASTDISVKTMSRLVESVKQNDVKTVFCTEMSTRNIANALSEQTGVRVAELHSAHNVTLEDFNNGTTYVDILYRNINALKEAF